MPRKLALTLAALVASLALAFVFALARPAAQTSADPNLDTEEQAFVTLINNYRQANGLGPLAIDWEMQSSSDWMSNDLGTRADHVFDHTDSLGRDPWTRMCAFGYCYNTWMGENIAGGYTTAAAVFAAWQASPGHNANMLGSHYIAMGISRFYTAGSTYGWYWTNDFGGVQSNAAPAAAPTNTPTPMPTPTPTALLTPAPTPTPSAMPTPTSGLTCPSGVVPPWHVPTGDPDCDGFTSSQETFIGTLPLLACAKTAAPNDEPLPAAWPVDFNDDQVANGLDLLTFAPVFGSIAPNAPYDARFDLNGDGRINGSDFLQFAPFFGKTCTP